MLRPWEPAQLRDGTIRRGPTRRPAWRTPVRLSLLTLGLAAIGGCPRLGVHANLAARPPAEVLLDVDGEAYRTIQVGGQSWMVDNLRAIRAPDGSALASHLPNDDPALVQTYGRLYDAQEALRACPRGWSLPSDADWSRLEDALRSSGFAVKDAATWRPPRSAARTGLGLQIRPAGYWNDQSFDNEFGARAVFWTATPQDEHFVWSRVVGEANDALRRAPQHPRYAFSVRCVAAPGRR